METEWGRFGRGGESNWRDDRRNGRQRGDEVLGFKWFVFATEERKKGP